jgi:hypothetical protein
MHHVSPKDNYTKRKNPNEIMLSGNENIKLNVPSSSEQLEKATLILFFCMNQHNSIHDRPNYFTQKS